MQPTVEPGARFEVSKVMPEEQKLDFIKSPVNLKERQMLTTETGSEVIWNE